MVIFCHSKEILIHILYLFQDKIQIVNPNVIILSMERVKSVIRLAISDLISHSLSLWGSYYKAL